MCNMMLVDTGINIVMVAPIKSRHADETKWAYKSILNHLHQAGIVPKKHVLDNKVLKSTETTITDKYHMKREVVLPYCHDFFQGK